VISNPKNGAMELQQDLQFIADIVVMIVASAAGGLLFAAMGQPVITGYLLAGSLVGPGGFGLINELVQVRTRLSPVHATNCRLRLTNVALTLSLAVCSSCVSQCLSHSLSLPPSDIAGGDASAVRGCVSALLPGRRVLCSQAASRRWRGCAGRPHTGPSRASERVT
jgi:hypothetical protein